MSPGRPLRELLIDVAGARVVRGDPARPVAEVRDDWRQVQAGDLFVAVPGTKSDGRRFVADALGKGAAVIVSESEPLPEEIAGHGAAWVVVPSARQAVGLIAAAHLGAAAAMA